MPTYQYRCTACGEPLEAVQSFTDDPLTDCPACGGRLRKVFSSVGIVFKGSGFYRNDSRAAEGSGGKPAETTPDKTATKETAPAAGKAEGSSEKTGEKTSEKKAEPAKSGGGGSTKKDAASTATTSAA